jgi:hypothetical protein
MHRRSFLARLGTAAVATPLFSSFVSAAAPTSPPAPRSFISRLLPAPVGGGFQREDSWIWCGSVIRGDDGLWHMFASMWTKSVPFNPNWLTNSRVVRATATNPLGPYTYAAEVLPPRGGNFWDGKMTHNPTVHRVGNTFLLFYTGTTYDGPIPDAGSPAIRRDSPLRLQARANQRIGLATAPSPAGPWTRLDRPILDVRPGQWDALLTTNAAPCIEPDGSVLLLYKSTGHDRDTLKYGVARAAHFRGPYERVGTAPIRWNDDPKISYEDAFVWREDGEYRVIFNDMTGRITGEDHAGGYATSRDGLSWQLGTPPKAYSRRVRWSDGTEVVQGSLERPQLILQNGHPTHLVCATADGPGGFTRASRTWSVVIPLAP